MSMVIACNHPDRDTSNVMVLLGAENLNSTEQKYNGDYTSWPPALLLNILNRCDINYREEVLKISCKLAVRIQLLRLVDSDE